MKNAKNKVDNLLNACHKTAHKSNPLKNSGHASIKNATINLRIPLKISKN